MEQPNSLHYKQRKLPMDLKKQQQEEDNEPKQTEDIEDSEINIITNDSCRIDTNEEEVTMYH